MKKKKTIIMVLTIIIVLAGSYLIAPGFQSKATHLLQAFPFLKMGQK